MLRHLIRNYRAFSTTVAHPMIVKPVACLGDNYAYLLLDQKSHQAAAVDPVEPDKVLAALKEYPEYKLTAILTTHHHWDHAGGNKKLLEQVPGIACYGGSDNVEGATHIVKDQDPISLGDLKVVPITTPCHTMDHICYYVSDADQHAVFTGDCVFSSGCGRFFEGTAKDMWKALQRIAALPDDTQMYFGHEYTLSNLRFAEHVEPDNKAIQEKKQWAQRVSCTTPSTIRSEKLTNPFFRVAEPAVQTRVLGESKTESAEKVLGIVRKMKDNFK
ncbi:putative hydroxyacylglutathione hydrolase [Dichotomocladium elegans]|nr:putative hydroxyacylglutathione hydrolase [Dichotomocladium elegans]